MNELHLRCGQVHVRVRECFVHPGACNCAVAFRENNNILIINACELGRPPLLIKALVDQHQPADDIKISADGLTYIVSSDPPTFNNMSNQINLFQKRQTCE